MVDNQLGFIFPGQGSQSTAMLAELATAYSSVEKTFAEASESLGFDLWALIQNNPDDELNLTQNTQPALLTCSVAIWRTWCELGGAKPAVLAGHSLGEYSALVCAEALSLADAVTLVTDRGKFMQEAVPEGVGAMAAILGLSDEAVVQVCENATDSQVVSAANFNSQGQVVVAGHRQAVERTIELAKEAGAKRAMLLAVSVPSHCALMKGAAERLAQRLEQVKFSDATIPVIQNVDALQRRDATGIKMALVKQLHLSVHWWKSIHKLKEAGISRIVECGPGKVLTGLIKRIDRSLEVFPAYDIASLEVALKGGDS